MKFKTGVFVASLLLFHCSQVMAQDSGTTRELQVKAAYLYNFTRFVNWESKSGTVPQKIIIGFIGADDIADVLDSFLKSSGNDNQVEVRRLHPDPPGLENCHILFIQPSLSVHMDDILARIRGKAILTVGDTPEFIKKGGMISLLEEGGRIRVVLDLKKAELNHLKVSSKLIEVSRLVKPEEP